MCSMHDLGSIGQLLEFTISFHVVFCSNFTRDTNVGFPGFPVSTQFCILRINSVILCMGGSPGQSPLICTAMQQREGTNI